MLNELGRAPFQQFVFNCGQQIFRRQCHDGEDDHRREDARGIEGALCRGDQQAYTVPRTEKFTDHRPTNAKPKLTCRLAKIQVNADGNTTANVTWRLFAPRM